MKIIARYQIGVSIPLDAGEALDRVTSERGWTPTHYARKALLDQLDRDLKQQSAPETPAEERGSHAVPTE